MSYSLDFFLGGPKKMPSVSELLAFMRATRGERVVHNGRIAGVIYFHPTMGKIYVTEREYDSHVFAKWRTVGVSRDVVRRLILEGVRYVVVYFRDRGWMMYTTPEKFMESGRQLWNKKEGDLQLHLGIGSFTPLPAKS
ncbi:MAG: hypothetical protein BA066_06150 [Candidatus Korarchaeota archaeon NZ13-K]|nr:MAG: hypothetical protein BA066_06150 [Candidatus Korarchaeota archaeon NZ13-K]